MKVDRIYEPKKEHRDWYFVEYHPANHFKFANVQLVLLIENVQEADLVLAMKMKLNIGCGSIQFL